MRFLIALACCIVLVVPLAKPLKWCARWKGVQRLAYPFYLFTYVHLALLLGPSALAGRDTAAISLAVYSVAVGAYVVLRMRRTLLRHHAPEPYAATVG